MTSSMEQAGSVVGSAVEELAAPELAENEGFLDKGRERRAAFAKKIANAQSMLSGWWNKGKSLLNKGADVGSAAIFATPDAAVAGYKAVEKKIEQGEDAIVFGGDVAYRAGQLGAYYANETFTDITNWSNKKTDQMAAWAEEKANNIAAAAALGAHLGSAAIGTVKEGAQGKIAEAKDKVKSRWGRMIGFGKNAIASAENKIHQLQAAKLARENAAKLAAAKTRLEKGLLMKEKAELEIARLEGKVILQNNLNLSIAA